MDIGNLDNLWDTGLFEKNYDIALGEEHYCLNSNIAWYRCNYTTDNYTDVDVFRNELNRYYQENVYND